jgi:hypothetical protein
MSCITSLYMFVLTFNNNNNKQDFKLHKWWYMPLYVLCKLMQQDAQIQIYVNLNASGRARIVDLCVNCAEHFDFYQL